MVIAIIIAARIGAETFVENVLEVRRRDVLAINYIRSRNNNG